MTILPLLLGFGILGYLLWLIVSLLKDWKGIVGETIESGKQKHETNGRIALDIAEEAGIGAAKVAAGYALGAIVGSAVGGTAAKGAGGGFAAGGGTFGGGGAAGSW